MTNRLAAQYDDNGNQTKVTDPTTADARTEYDARGRVRKTCDGLDRVTETHYNALGQVDWGLLVASPDSWQGC